MGANYQSVRPETLTWESYLSVHDNIGRTSRVRPHRAASTACGSPSHHQGIRALFGLTAAELSHRRRA